MMKFNIGDAVEVLDDTVSGIVLKVDDNGITIEIEDGFQLKYHPSELVKVSNAKEITITNYEAAQIKKEKEIPKRRKSTVLKTKERNAPKMEVDLHIHQLTPKFKGMSNHEMLNLQVETAKRQLEFAMRKRIQKVVFIHGVGAGVLKEELKYLFKRYDNIKYYDADYQKYGLGATEIYIFQNA